MRLALALAFLVLAASAFATPEFARAYREYKITCYSCHTQPPKLTKFGEDFVKNGYSIPGKPRMDTTPLAVWVSGQLANSNTQPGTYRTVPNRIEIISGGRSGGNSYFIEWRVLSKELLNDGSYRDRSGRFEDLFVIFGVDDSIQFQVGQFRAMSQIDVSRRLFLSEPAAFSTAMPGEADPDPRIQSLRGFSLSGRAPSARVTLAQGEWTASVTVPFPGEISVPLTKEARDTASFEFEGSPKGAFVEFYRREDQDSVGLHAFFGDNDRTLVRRRNAGSAICGSRAAFRAPSSRARTNGATACPPTGSRDTRLQPDCAWTTARSQVRPCRSHRTSACSKCPGHRLRS